MLTPQKILKDYRDDRFLKENLELLFPVYKSLFDGAVSKTVVISNEIKKQINILSSYFDYIESLSGRNRISLTGSYRHDGNVIGRLVELVEDEKLSGACLALSDIVKFIKRERTNINNLEFFSWGLFNETRKEDIEKNYIDKPETIKNALLNPIFLILLIKFPGFGELILQDLMMPVELKSPSRRKGSFGDKAFNLIFSELKKSIPDLNHKEKTLIIELAKSNNWYMTENATSAVGFPKPKSNSKYVDMVCKLGKLLIIASHKEQRQGGGGQDNQAEDAGSIFKYDKITIEKIKSQYNVNDVKFFIFLEGSGVVIKSNHWAGIVKKIESRHNTDKYLLNSVQFIKWVKSLK